MMTTVATENQIIAEIRIQSAASGHHNVAVRPGDRLFVGSDDGSEIQLCDEGVAAIHCLITANDSQVSIQDYYSEAGTIVNGDKVRQGVLPDQAQIVVGSAILNLSLRKQVDQGAAATPSSVSPAPEEKLNPIDDQDVQQVAEASREFSEPAAAGPVQQIEDLQLQLEQAESEVQILQRRLASAESSIPTSSGDPFQDEMIELLRAEVLELQATVAEREEQLAAMSQGQPSATEDQEQLSQTESERLVGRLEQLLTELQQRDEQIATLTQLLDTAEVACKAEQAERSQLNSWLNDIEERFGSRESDWQAERSKLQQDIEDLTVERDRLEQAMNVDTSSAKLEACQQMIVRLREANAVQQQQLEKTQSDLREAESRLEESNQPRSREEQIRLAEERAEIARERQQLEAERRTLQQEPNDTSMKLRVLRQHLNEIHEQERQEKEERKLSRRVARLWSRLDGRS